MNCVGLHQFTLEVRSIFKEKRFSFRLHFSIDIEEEQKHQITDV